MKDDNIVDVEERCGKILVELIIILLHTSTVHTYVRISYCICRSTRRLHKRTYVQYCAVHTYVTYVCTYYGSALHTLPSSPNWPGSIFLDYVSRYDLHRHGK